MEESVRETRGGEETSGKACVDAGVVLEMPRLAAAWETRLAGAVGGTAEEGCGGPGWELPNWGSDPFVLALVGGSVSLLPELLQGGVLLAHFVSRGLQSVCIG